MKKTIALVLSLVMVLTALLPVALADGQFTAGTYTAAADGKFGPVNVEVTFSETAITDITVGENSETPNFAGPVIDTIPGAIIESQSLAVDAVSGATLTSVAILNAVADCVKQAGGDPEAMKNPAETTPAEVGDRTATVEVLVIGGGGTGLAAAMSAMDNGAKNVMLVEKMGTYGGSTSVSGTVIAAENTYFTDRSGFVCSKEAWMDSWKASSDSDIGVLGKDPGYPTYTRVEKYYDQVSKAVNWLEDKGVATWTSYPLFGVSHYQIPDYICDENGMPDPEGGYMMVNKMVDYLKANGCDMRLNSKGAKLLVDEKGDVIGATIEDKQGAYDVYATRGVVLATGGFPQSQEMMDQYLPQFADWLDLSTAGKGDTGDGMRMAVEVGGEMYNDPYVITLGSTSRIPALSQFCVSINLWKRLVVNSKGQRFFNEGQMPYQATVALSRTEDKVAWALGDSNYADVATLEASVDGYEVVKADTIEELAAAMGADPEALTATLSTYNTACANGEDKEFGKGADNLVALDKAPYYAVRIYVCTGGTIGGVKTNEDFQVLRADGSVIGNLYAGGEVSNREMYAYAYSSGSGVGYALSSGYTIGQEIMK